MGSLNVQRTTGFCEFKQLTFLGNDIFLEAGGNRLLRGWENDSCLGPVSKADRAVDAHARYQFRWWLCRKHRVRGRAITQFSDEHLYRTLGLARLAPLTHTLPWANA